MLFLPCDGADGKLRRRLRLVHQKLQIDTALITRNSHHWICLSLVTIIEQPRDQSGKRHTQVFNFNWHKLSSEQKIIKMFAAYKDLTFR